MKKQHVQLIAALVAISAVILYLESLKPPVVTEKVGLNVTEKLGKYPQAKEIVNPSGFINADNITVRELVGKNVILVDFWTYSCINCQRTLPYINSWYDKYSDKGLEIIGVHTPEFSFEEDIGNVRDAVERFNIEYPVVLDNDYSTWNAYRNRFWPRKYLIDIDGFIVYDHAGEGAYEETEEKIVELLEERRSRLGLEAEVSLDETWPDAVDVDFGRIGSPEVYFGAGRNELLSNGVPGNTGRRMFNAPEGIADNSLYLVGEWNIHEEYAENLGDAEVIFKFTAKRAHMVASSPDGVDMEVLVDSQPTKTVQVQEEMLYNLVDMDDYGTHVLRLRTQEPGLQAYTFTFG